MGCSIQFSVFVPRKAQLGDSHFPQLCFFCRDSGIIASHGKYALVTSRRKLIMQLKYIGKFWIATRTDKTWIATLKLDEAIFFLKAPGSARRIDVQWHGWLASEDN